MSRSILSAAARQLWRQQLPRPGVPAFPTPKSRRTFSATFCEYHSISIYASKTTYSGRTNSPPKAVVHLQPRSAFSSSSLRPATKVLQNPRVGEDGNPLTIEISPRAAEVRPPLLFLTSCSSFISLGIWGLCWTGAMLFSGTSVVAVDAGVFAKAEANTFARSG
ncbi:hypothetical protein BDV28DRAFT_13385 [Aspergillus coremiiformis]|uniref:Uncharacterized protein n=1 Tax=Aspergillus coremiiformis TaxID=138285 RepID=A0A5N6Z293_9EURO|nr:hypothetical protein BDV28DRAFT_13385 [Aspergillus coremiiformis]